MPLKPPLPPFVLPPRTALAVLLLEADGKPIIIAQLMQVFQLAVLAMYQRSQLGLLPAATR